MVDDWVAQWRENDGHWTLDNQMERDRMMIGRDNHKNYDRLTFMMLIVSRMVLKENSNGMIIKSLIIKRLSIKIYS